MLVMALAIVDIKLGTWILGANASPSITFLSSSIFHLFNVLQQTDEMRQCQGKKKGWKLKLIKQQFIVC